MSELDDETSEEPKPTGKATASMILGITSLLTLPLICLAGVGPPALCAIVGLILGLMSRKAANKGQSLTGIITSACSLTLILIFTIASTLVFRAASQSIENSDGGFLNPFFFDEEQLQEWIDSQNFEVVGEDPEAPDDEDR